MDDRLSIYLHDHLAGANFAVELLKNLEQHHCDDETGALVREILAEVVNDRQVLEDIIKTVGKSSFDAKDAMAWLGEKVSRIKLGHGDRDALPTFEALETLSLGIQGKVALWRVLQVVAETDERLAGWDFTALSSKAQDQFNRVEKYKLSVARVTFQSSHQNI
jgi:hypothetical protein